MKTRSVLLLVAGMALLSATDRGHAAVEVTTDPVGFVSVNVPVQSDAVLAVPLYRTPVFRAGIQTIDTGTNTITVAASPGWAVNQFVQAIPTQNDTFAVLIATGDPATGKEGLIGKITANGANSLTIQLEEGASLTGVKSEATHAGSADQIDIVPYWTPVSLLGTALPAGVQMLLFPTDQSGININSQITLTKGATSWFNESVNADHLQLFFGQGFVIRNATSSAQVVSMVGSVPMAKHRSVLKKNSAVGVAQDIRIGYSSPIPEKIGDLSLGFTNGDQLLVFDNSAAGQNKSATTTLVFIDNKWYKGATDVTTTFELQPGQGYVFRRAPAAPTGNTTWATMQSYLQ